MEAAGLLLAGPKANLKAKLTEKARTRPAASSEDAPANAGRRERSEQGAKAVRTYTYHTNSTVDTRYYSDLCTLMTDLSM